jgi:hypothetical protein
MMTEAQAWTAANQQYLMAALAGVRQALQRHLGETDGDADHDSLETAPIKMPAPAALETLARTFGLSSFERDLLLLCAGLELDAKFAALCATTNNKGQPTFSLALAALPEAHWSALTPTAPLRRWRLIEVGSGSNLMDSPLRIDERVLHYLTGASHLDEQLLGFVEAMAETPPLTPSQRQVVAQVITIWSGHSGSTRLPVVQLCGPERATKQALAAAICAGLGLGLYKMDVHVIPTTPHELDILLRLWEREAALSGCALLLDADLADSTDQGRQPVITRFIDSLGSPLLVTCRDRRADQQRPLLTFEVNKPTALEQRALWERALGDNGPLLNGQVDGLTAQFNLNAPAIEAAYLQATGYTTAASQNADMAVALWQACRAQARPQLDNLAQRIEPVARWDDLVLPEREHQVLRDIAIHVRQRAQVYETWGFAHKSARGLGISALFAGPSGTGKTMAAEVLANELDLDLYRIDLSQVVSKYIGETEKNLARVFDAAEAGGTILLFDEADALFGKRGEVKDSHDRYANIEVSYLLQRMEAYRGLAVLTTNMKSALDQAFWRRLRFAVQFPFPTIEQRAAIWQRIFPVETPTKGLDPLQLAQLNVAGGNIRNIAMNAAFYAADAGQPVCMAHILRAARSEYSKLDKTLTNAEIRGWE